eukprot:CAMPEP_0184362770 /NCGR_PEP_ID=MMETSP1089-20130417/136459_1 /TAXON_ID=38269 ORGANISM="Gloeochaete wittrockiana, Strain SAG46.84" /NCGR_SAMPLE_ID=MMETSP1089 /ASSEMBLY_ACC=CAM_ASM_000445 /LENGTH=372 /DNA_ID=CAMNT_0026703001 /DNA_START=38 /DNA_END=1156 /DNA_ORIENTATION=-
MGLSCLKPLTSTLTALDLKDCEHIDDGATFLVKQLTQLTSLNLSGCGIRSWTSYAPLSCLTKLQSLELSSCNEHARTAHPLFSNESEDLNAESVAGLSTLAVNLTRLGLHRVRSDAGDLASACSSLTALRSLYIGKEEMDEPFSPPPELSSLSCLSLLTSLSFLGLDPHIDHFSCLSSLNQLRFLWLADVGSPRTSVAYLSSLTDLILAISQENQADLLPQLITACPSLLKLDLWGVRSELWTQTLAPLYHLRTFKMVIFNVTQDERLRALSSYLALCPDLVSLELIFQMNNPSTLCELTAVSQLKSLLVQLTSRRNQLNKVLLDVRGVWLAFPNSTAIKIFVQRNQGERHAVDPNDVLFGLPFLQEEANVE